MRAKTLSVTHAPGLWSRFLVSRSGMPLTSGTHDDVALQRALSAMIGYLLDRNGGSLARTDRLQSAMPEPFHAYLKDVSDCLRDNQSL